jgi:hypothetical protein
VLSRRLRSGTYVRTTRQNWSSGAGSQFAFASSSLGSALLKWSVSFPSTMRSSLASRYVVPRLTRPFGESVGHISPSSTKEPDETILRRQSGGIPEDWGKVSLVPLT